MLVVKTTSPLTSPSPAKARPEKEVPSSNTTNARFRPRLSPDSKPCSRSVVHRIATDYRGHDASLEPPSEVRAVRGPTAQGVLPDRPLFREVHEHEVRGRTRKDPTSPAPDPTPRSAGYGLDEARERKFSAVHQLRVECREGRLVPQKAGRGLLQRELLLRRGVWGVVRSHKVEGTVLKSLPDPEPVAIRS